MMVNTTDNKAQDILVQEKVDTNVIQQKNDPNLNTDKQITNATASSQSLDSESGIDPNWKAFREARKKDRAQREAAERKAMEKEQEVIALKTAMEAAFAKGSSSPQAYQQYYGMNQESNEESEEQKINKIIDQKLAQREAIAEKERLEREQREYPNRLIQTYPDFNQVISQDNLDYLDYHYPEVSRPLQELPDGFNKYAHIYHAVKKFVPNNINIKKEMMKAENNMSKPKSISSTGLTQSQSTSSSHGLTEEKKAANWERMQQVRKGLG